MINQIPIYWRGSDLNAKTPPLATWKLIARPKKQGVLGIIKLRAQNDANNIQGSTTRSGSG